jgi:hypothetical protein
MIRHLLTSILILSALSNSISAQQFILSGKVKDKNTSEPLSFCSVAMISNDTMRFFAITDDKGYFEIPASADVYKTVFRYVGYHTDTVITDLRRDDLFLGTIKMEPLANELKGAEVKASVNTNEIDRDEFLITKKIRTGAANTSDVLDRINGITYDRYKDRIKVDNDPNIIILVNGIEKNSEYIKNLNPDRIAKVEIIRDPSGKYGIEGYSAIVNIKLKTNYVGNDLTLHTMNMFDFDAEGKYVLPVSNYYGGYNYTKKNLNAYLSAGGGFNNFSIPNSVITKYHDSLDIEQLPPDSGMNMSHTSKWNYITAGGDYRINSIHTVSFEANYSGQPNTISSMDYVNNYYTDSLIYKDTYKTINTSNSANYYASGFYTGNFSRTKILTADFSFSGNSSKTTNDYAYTPGGDFKSGQDNNTGYSKFNLQWSHTPLKKISYQIGYGNTFKKMNNNTLYIDTNITFDYKEIRNKAFAYLIWRPLKKLSFKAGLGVENSLPSIEDKGRLSFWIFKPHADIFYKPNNTINIKLKYRVDSRYPSIGEMNPAEILTDRFTVRKGNPDLIPTAINKASLRINILNGLFSAEAYYHFSENYIAPVGQMRPDGLFEYSYANIGKYNNRGIEFNITIPLGKNIIWQNNLEFYHSEMSYEGHLNKISDWDGEMNLIYINYQSGLNAGIIYQRSNNKVISLQGYSNQENDFWAVMVQKPLFKKSFTIMFLYMLPVDFGADYNQVTYINTDSYTQTSTTDINILKNMFMVQLSYRFHRGKEIKSIKKTIEKEDEGTQKKGLF